VQTLSGASVNVLSAQFFPALHSDNLMKRYRRADPVFFAAYQSARGIVDKGTPAPARNPAPAKNPQ
jgi:hypothetical protein